VRPRSGKFFFHKIYSSVLPNFFLSSYVKLTKVLIISYGIIIKSINTLMCKVWHVDKYKITFKLVIKFQENLSRPGIIDSRARYRAAARRLRNTALDNVK